MATTYTTNAMLGKPAVADRSWDVTLNANADALDGVAAIGRLAVTPTEIPSASLNVRVTAGTYVKADGTMGSFPGAAAYAVSASTTAALWLTDAGVLGASAAYPTTAHVRLARVTTGTGSIAAVADDRAGPRTCGTGLGFVLKSGDTVAGTLAVASAGNGASALVVNGNAGTVGFFGATPASQATAVVAVTDNSNGAASNAISDVGSSYSQATIDNNFATLAAKLNAVIATLKRHGLMSS